MHSEMNRDSVLVVLIDINQLPNMGVKIKGGAIIRAHEDTFIYEEILLPRTVPDDWFPI